MNSRLFKFQLCIFPIVFVLLTAIHQGYGQVYDIDPYLTVNSEENNAMLKDYGYTLSLFLNAFEPARGNLVAESRVGFIGKRTSVQINKDNRTGILSGRKKWNCDMVGIAMAITPKMNADFLFHNGEEGGTNRRPLMWQGTLKYDLISAKSLNHMYISMGYGEVRYVKDFYYKHFTIDGAYNGRSRRAGYTVGVGVNRYIFDIHPSLNNNGTYSSKIIKNLFKMNLGVQFYFQSHWQFSASYTRAYFTTYQFEILFYL